jgi:hypothetical protein
LAGQEHGRTIPLTDIPVGICLVQEHVRRGSVRIHPRRATQV